MIALDTNIIVRFFTRDDEKQYKKAYVLLQSEAVFIPDTVILETEWVLRFAYGFSPAAISAALRKLLGLRNVQLANAAQMAQVIDWHEKGLDFSDAMHLAGCEECEKLYTFDKKFASRSEGLSNCPVVLP